MGYRNMYSHTMAIRSIDTEAEIEWDRASDQNYTIIIYELAGIIIIYQSRYQL